MSKLTTTDIANITGAESTAIANINNNFEAVETAIENTLSRDGTTPNQMDADLDMNANDLLNVGLINSSGLTVNGLPVFGTQITQIVSYDTRNAANASSAVSLGDDAIVVIEGYFYKVDTSATGSSSVTNDLGVDGLVVQGQPFPEHYGFSSTSNITLTPTDPWQEILECHPGGGGPVIFLDDGLYEINGFMRTNRGKSHRLRIEAVNRRLATLKGEIILENGSALELDHLVYEGPDSVSNVGIRGDDCELTFRDCEIDFSSTLSTNAYIAQIVNGYVNFIAEGDNHCEIRCGVNLPNTFSFKNCLVQIFGNASGLGRVELYASPDGTLQREYFGGAGTRFVVDGLQAISDDVGNGLCFNIIRGSHITVTGSGRNRIEGFQRGILAQNNSKGYVADTTFEDNTQDIRTLDESEIVVDEASCTFVSGASNFVKEDKVNTIAGRNPNYQAWFFHTEAENVSDLVLYLGPSGSFTTESRVRIHAPFDFKVVSATFSTSQGPGSGRTVDGTLRVAGGDTVVTLALDDTETNETGDFDYDVSKGAAMSVKLDIPAGTPARSYTFMLVIEPTL